MFCISFDVAISKSKVSFYTVAVTNSDI